MIVCPNCKHENPEGATSCEACYTALPATKACPNCGAAVQLDATFCGQCGQNLIPATPTSPSGITAPKASPSASQTIPTVNNPALEPATSGLPPTILTGKETNLPSRSTPPATVETASIDPHRSEIQLPLNTEAVSAPSAPPTVASTPDPSPPQPLVETPVAPVVSTQLQQSTRKLLHLQTNTTLEVPPHLQVIHIGKPNDQAPPDLDVSGFPSAEVVSRVHANIRIEGENYYIEDVGSANGTYVNHNLLPRGNRHLLRSGDRIGLGKGDLVTLIFQ